MNNVLISRADNAINNAFNFLIDDSYTDTISEEVKATMATEHL